MVLPDGEKSTGCRGRRVSNLNPGLVVRPFLPRVPSVMIRPRSDSEARFHRRREVGMGEGLLGNNVIHAGRYRVRESRNRCGSSRSSSAFPVPWCADRHGGQGADALPRAPRRRAKLAFMHFGSIDIELIEPGTHPARGASTSAPWCEVDHLAFIIEGMADRSLTRGARTSASSRKASTPVAATPMSTLRRRRRRSSSCWRTTGRARTDAASRIAAIVGDFYHEPGPLRVALEAAAGADARIEFFTDPSRRRGSGFPITAC